jgi:hypothetical protein
MSNNAAERAIRALTLGRRNWTCVNSNTSGTRATVFYTIIQTAKLNGINPEAYLTDIIQGIADHPAKNIDQLLPWNSAPKSQGHVHTRTVRSRLERLLHHS